MRTAVYAGSFDPLTSGHMWVIKEGARLFDKLIVAIGTNPGKSGRYMFSVEERREMTEKTVASFSSTFQNVTVESMSDEYLYSFALRHNAEFILRGVRNIVDFEYEQSFCAFNKKAAPSVSTVFLTPPHEVGLISSSFIKGLIGYKGWEALLYSYVPQVVYDKIILRSAK